MITGYLGQNVIDSEDGYMRYDTRALYDYVLSNDPLWVDGEYRIASEMFENLIDREQIES